MGRYGGRMHKRQNRISDRFIIKMQVSLVTTARQQQVVVYNRDKSIRYEEDISEAVKEIMKGRPKAYFYARLRGTVVAIEGEAPVQDW